MESVRKVSLDLCFLKARKGVGEGGELLLRKARRQKT